MAAAWSGKVKTCIQIAAIIAIFLDSSLFGGGIITPVAGWAATLITIYSGWDYMSRNWALVAEGATKPKLK
jgi:CDP-diacylglycerol--glycerol-3-phosphate 3-phosphatidyltransferase